MATFIIGAIVFGLLFLALWSMIKKSKDNKGGCGCGCSGCSSKKLSNREIELKLK